MSNHFYYIIGFQLAYRSQFSRRLSLHPSQLDLDLFGNTEDTGLATFKALWRKRDGRVFVVFGNEHNFAVLVIEAFDGGVFASDKAGNYIAVFGLLLFFEKNE